MRKKVAMPGRIKFIRALIQGLFPFFFIQGLFGGLTAFAAGGQFSLSKPLSLKWKFETAETLGLAPAAARDSVYLPLAGGRIISLDLSNGSLIWKAELGGDVSADPDADESGVYVATETPPLPRSPFPQATGAIRALGRVSGVGLWMRTLPAPIRGSLVSNERTLFGASADGRVYALKKQTGEILWVKQFTTSFLSSPILHGDYLVICDGDGEVIEMEQSSGNIHWRYRTRKKAKASPAVSNDFVYVGTADGNVFAFEKATGRLRWRARTGVAVQSVEFAGRCLLATSLDNFVYCLSPQKGAKLWKRQLAGRILARPLATPQDVLLSPLAGDESVVLDLQEGKKTNSIHTGEDNNTGASPVLSDGILLLTTRTGLAAYWDQSQSAGPSIPASPSRR